MISEAATDTVTAPPDPRRRGRYSVQTPVRWLVLALGILAVMWATYAGMTHRVFESANGVTGELLKGQSVGQTFVARYHDLSAVEVRAGTYASPQGETRATLVLHVRDSSTSRVDLATATVPTSNITPSNS
jgi:hypothetical protein